MYVLKRYAKQKKKTKKKLVKLTQKGNFLPLQLKIRKKQTLKDKILSAQK